MMAAFDSFYTPGGRPMFNKVEPLSYRGQDFAAVNESRAGRPDLRFVCLGGVYHFDYNDACSLRDWLIAATKPGYAEMERDAERWRACEKHGFPTLHLSRKIGFHTEQGHTEQYWSFTLDIAELPTFKGKTPAEAIDAAIDEARKGD